MFFRTTALLVQIIGILFTCSQAWAMMDLNSDTPIHVSAEKMVSHDKEKAVVFSGDVRAKQGDVLINAQTMTIYHRPQKGDQGQEERQQVDKIIAEGNVEIIQEGFVATGDRVEYFASEEKIILKGHAKIIQDNNMVTGYQVEMDLANGTTTVTPEKGEKVTVEGKTVPSKKPKVEMYFYPKSDPDKTR